MKKIEYINSSMLNVASGISTITNKEDLERFWILIKNIPNCKMLDIGANKGYYSLLTTLKEDLLSYAFEPLQSIYKRFLVKNLELNNVSHKVHVYNFGLLNKKISTYLYYDNSENATIEKDVEKETHIYEMKKKYPTAWCYNYTKSLAHFHKLDNIVEIDDKVDVVKIDVEGAELLTLQGGKQFFKKQRPILYIEIEERHCIRFKTKIVDVLDYIRLLGYTKIKSSGDINYICKK